MRTLTVACGLVLLSAVACRQTPPIPSPSTSAAPKPDITLAELMRGINFPNSNIIFNVQHYDPALPKPEYHPGNEPFSWIRWGQAIYPAWDEVQYAAGVLTEMPDLIQKPGRLCSNGKPVPLDRPDFVQFAEALRGAARVALAAAREKDQAKVTEATNVLVDACVNCHNVYRNAPPGGERRCIP